MKIESIGICLLVYVKEKAVLRRKCTHSDKHYYSQPTHSSPISSLLYRCEEMIKGNQLTMRQKKWKIVCQREYRSWSSVNQWDWMCSKYIISKVHDLIKTHMYKLFISLEKTLKKRSYNCSMFINFDMILYLIYII